MTLSARLGDTPIVKGSAAADPVKPPRPVRNRALIQIDPLKPQDSMRGVARGIESGQIGCAFYWAGAVRGWPAEE